MIKRSELPIFLIGMHNYVEGATRLQKYAFLSAMQIKELRNVEFYDDWKASNFGPFSAKLASDMETVINNNQIKKHTITNAYGFKVNRFAVTEQGKEIFERLKYEYSSLHNKIIKITRRYQEYSLSQLLQNVYYQYPQYASASTIKAKVGKGIYESDSYLSTNYDEPDL